MMQRNYRNGLLAHDETRVRKAYASKGDDSTLTRFVKIPNAPKSKHPRQLVIPRMGHPTIEVARTLFYRKGIRKPEGNILVSGHSNVKIGRDVRKGALRGYWIYTLSLEERATCPRTCTHWYDCYGNNMPFTKRINHRDANALQTAIADNIARLLAVRNRMGILVRLHALGDFFSVEYVNFWRSMLLKHERLAVYGYTARTAKSTIGREVVALRNEFGGRAAIRISDGPGERWNTASIATREEARKRGAIACPEQTGQTLACATCALCWATDKTIAFTDH